MSVSVRQALRLSMKPSVEFLAPPPPLVLRTSGRRRRPENLWCFLAKVLKQMVQNYGFLPNRPPPLVLRTETTGGGKGEEFH